MAKLKLNMTMSLDGYVGGANQSLENPLGEGGLALHEWAFATRSFRAAHGLDGDGETGLDDSYTAKWNENIGATIMGRNMFGPVRGSWDEAWTGWWGDDPPFHTPVFVLTHHTREPIEMAGGTTFHFVTDGIEAALEQATKAAGGKDVGLGGGASAAQQYLSAGLVDELEIHVVPMLLGGGSRLFENLDGGPAGYKCISVESSPAVAHFRYVRKDTAPG